jgi:hypothetical protein
MPGHPIGVELADRGRELGLVSLSDVLCLPARIRIRTGLGEPERGKGSGDDEGYGGDSFH